MEQEYEQVIEAQQEVEAVEYTASPIKRGLNKMMPSKSAPSNEEILNYFGM